jgi:hypothetical protein
MGMKKTVGLALVIINRDTINGISGRKPRKKKPRMQQTTSKLESLEQWFENSAHPAPTSRIAELMRELLEKNPDLGFERLHELARGDVIPTVRALNCECKARKTETRLQQKHMS